MEFDIKPILKALLISTGDPLDPKDIQKLFERYVDEILEDEGELQEETESVEGREDAGAESDLSGSGESPAATTEVPRLVTVTRIREAIDEIQSDLETGNEVYRILETHQGFRIVTAPEYADWIRLLRHAPRPLRLSPAALETLSIIAYRQPVTRSEMETIRGVSVDSAINKLLELELIQVTGRAELPGRPLQYGTTEKFMEFCGIRSLEELPASDIITQSRLDAWIRQANQQQSVSDEDVGLPAVEPEITETSETSDLGEGSPAEPESQPENENPALKEGTHES